MRIRRRPLPSFMRESYMRKHDVIPAKTGLRVKSQGGTVLIQAPLETGGSFCFIKRIPCDEEAECIYERSVL